MEEQFTWEKFPETFIKAILESPATPDSLKPKIRYEDKDFLIPYMESICPRPDDVFVRKYRREIEDAFLKETDGVLRICKRLRQLNMRGAVLSDNQMEMLENLRHLPLSGTLCRCYADELCGYGGEPTFRSVFTTPIQIDLRRSDGTDSGLHPYQEEAVSKLARHFLKENGKAGILMMPTGSGKTRTSVHFLLREMVSRGYQVIWLAHRSMLLEQAAETFYRLSPLILEHSPNRETFFMAVISGEHARAQAMRPEDDAILGSVQSLYRNPEYLPQALKDKVIIVVDEAHHAIAPSYKAVIGYIRAKRPDAKLLGLTATPIRINDRDTLALRKMFENTILHSVGMGELIANGTLAKPNYIPRETNLDIEAIITLDEEKYIQKWKEMPDSLLDKVAKTNERNELIVGEYMSHREEYGKTLVFALNGIHCLALDDEFKKRGVKSEYVYTVNRNNRETIERFRDSGRPDSIDVLININMLTEGSDIPDIQTVFLTRPTGSDTLLMQMVGRGMRGKGFGGTESVNIVDFCDKWSSITRWMNPKAFMDDLSGEEPVPDKETVQGKKPVLIPVDMIRDLISGITYRNARMSGKPTVLPLGWYDVTDEDGNDEKVLVFDNQTEGYERLKADLKRYCQDKSLTAENAIEEYFGGFGMLPDEDELDALLSTARRNQAFPVLNLFEERDAIEPYRIARKFRNGEADISNPDAYFQELYGKYRDLIDSIYGGQAAYRQKVSDYLFFPNGVRPLGANITEVERSLYRLSQEPQSQSLEDLLTAVIEEQKERIPQPFTRPSIQWTDRDYASYFGAYNFARNEIRINRILNSASVPEEVVKFVIYHECLHQEFPKHTREFRRLERMYPDFGTCEYFLDYSLRDYDREYAM